MDDDRLLGRSWRSLALLHGANIGHRQIDLETVALLEGDVGLVDFAATVSPSDDQLQTDRAQLLAATAAVAGTDRGVRAALESLGAEGVAALLPYLQPAALRTPLRRAAKAAGIDLDELRAQAAGVAGEELLCAPRKLAMLIGGNIATELLFAIALGLFCPTSATRSDCRTCS